MTWGDLMTKIQLIIPTSINLLTAVNDALVTLTKAGETPSVALPSLRRRALMVVKEIGVLPIQTVVPDDDSFTR